MPEPLVLEVDLPTRRETILVPPGRSGERLTDPLRRAGIALNTRCGEQGLCEGCVVELTSGRLQDLSRVATLEPASGPLLVRACQCRLAGAGTVRIRVPARSLLGHAPQVESRFTINVPRAHSPLCQSVQLRGQDLRDTARSTERLRSALAERLKTPHAIHCPEEVAGQLSRFADRGDVYVSLDYDGKRWSVTGIADRSKGPGIGVAVDVGTTTVVLLLVDLDTGELLAEATDLNGQVRFGEDVVTRIGHCTKDPGMVQALQEAIARATLGPLLQSALWKAGRSTDDVACFTVAGNTTMLHLLAGVDPTPLGRAPFTPAFLEHRVVRAADLEWITTRAHAKGGTQKRENADDRADTAGAGRGGPPVHLLPGAAAYVGADVCAGVLASGLVYDEGPSLLVDVGTNGEIVLKHGPRLLGCATAAGPAFEGCGLTCGTRAGDGAISHLYFTTDPLTVRTEVIGDSTPVGICGSAYIDFLAQARRQGVINRIGRFDLDALPRAGHWLIHRNDSGLALRVATGPGEQPLVVSEADIAVLLQAKAAVAAGILTLLERFGVSPADVRRVYLAGGFGLHLEAASAVGCGLLPGFRSGQIEFLGNSSLAGAYLALLDSGAVEELVRISQRIEVVELNRDPGFEERYIQQLQLPP